MAGSRKRKMDDETRIQGALSKRRACLLRKANEISVNCNVDIALAAFSPFGHFCKFFSLEKTRHVLERYIKLPPEKRHQNVTCLEWKFRRMKQLDNIEGDENKLFHLENEVKNLELQIKKAQSGLEVLNTSLKKYEVENAENASFSQVSCCGKNPQHSLQEIKDRKERSPKERYPSMGQTRPQQRSHGRQTSFISNFRPGKQVWNRERQNLKSSLRRQHGLRTYPYRSGNSLRDKFYQPRGISPGSPGASSSFAGYPPIYRLGSSCLTQQNAVPPVYPPIQTLSGIQNLQNRMHGKSSMQQPIMGSPAIPYVPYQQPLRVLGTSNLYQLRMPGMMNQQMGLGGSGSSSVNQSLMGNGNKTSNVHFQHQQQGVLGITSLGQHANNESSEGQSNITSNVQFLPQQQGVLGSTSVGQQVKNVPFGGQHNQTPTSYDNHIPQDGASTMPLISQLQVNPHPMNLLCSTNCNIMQNFDVTSLLNFESPAYNTMQSLDVIPLLNSESTNCNAQQDFDVPSFFNSESPNCNTLQDLDVTSFLNSESPNCNTLQDLDVTSFFNSESPNCNTLPDLDFASFFNIESPNFNTLQNSDVIPPLNSESPNYNIPQNLDVTPPLTPESTLQNLDVTPTSNFESPNYNTVQNLDVTPFLNSESIHIYGDDSNGNTNNSNTSNKNAMGNNDTNGEENPQPESPCSMFINGLLSISSESFLCIPIHKDDNNVNNGDTNNRCTNNNNALGNNDTNGEENPHLESPCSMFINNILSVSSESFFSIPIHENDNNVSNGNTDNNNNNNNNTINNNDPNGKEIPQPESPYSIFINSLFSETTMEEGTSAIAANREGNNSMEWDDFVLSDKMNLKDFALPDNMTLEDFEKLF